MTLRATLYSRVGCHLCEAAEADLARLRARYPHTLDKIDIDAEPEFERRFGERIPVLDIYGVEYAAPLPLAVLERALAEGIRRAASEPGRRPDTPGGRDAG